ncbi:DUF4175 domain-containing protein [Hymenobacter sp. J193]|uniref:DUF4175 domain-containing protein n=1 Tax=Hymenobacter sp. J193 TaxID=2898429 RepID=UPI00215122FF|nr:DUF4175 domain-containing protein [Hymenobacter sp. J193]MCR5887911.1 DUF4175 domain-containing protein [Hymenobacter sp. J193]
MSLSSTHTATAQLAPTRLLRAVWQRRFWRQLLALLLPLMGMGGLAGVAFSALPSALVWSGLVLALLLLVGYAWQLSRPNLPLLARQLDRQYPSLEDSTGLLLRPATELQFLEHLQQQRTSEVLRQLLAEPGPLLPVSWRAPLWLTAGLLTVAAGTWAISHRSATTIPTAATAPLHFPAVAEKGKPLVARIISTSITVAPPAYTRQPGFTAAQPSFRCPAGSRVRWLIRVNEPKQPAPQLEIGRRHMGFRPVAGQRGTYAVELVVSQSMLYRVRYAGQVSDDYAIEALPDRAPTVQVQTPKPYTLIEFGTRPQVPVRVAVHDDYGLARARLVATVAQGQGEGVKFREVVQDLTSQLPGQPTRATLSHVLRLPALGLTYGDEVYFYVQLWDTHQQMSRSDSYLVQWEDTTIDDSNMDVSLGVTTVPAYFRSQRQIIIDTEKLLTEKAALTTDQFVARGNEIGHDQKILRLRYGKFMGEEFSESIGENAGAGAEPEADHDEHAGEEPGHDEHQHAPPSGAASAAANTAETAALMEAYVHSHDDAETADFLEPAVKAKLSIVLSQMWEAELRLRTGRPREALPFEYKALRLLKQVQQQTRLYVKKSGFEAPPLPEATLRLTGDLAGAATVPRRSQQSAPPAQPAVRAALRVVSELQTGRPVRPTDAAALEAGGQALALAAQRQPGTYLAALRHLRQLTTELRAGQRRCTTCLAGVEHAFTRLLPAPYTAPTRPAGTTRLTQRYLQELR